MQEIRIEGLEEAIGLLGRFFDRAIAGLEKGLYHEGLEAGAFSTKIIPVDTGTARASLHVELPRRKGSMVEVQVSYGGAAESYVFRLHEDLDAWHAPGTEAKFLEKGAMSRENGMGERLRDAVKQEVG